MAKKALVNKAKPQNQSFAVARLHPACSKCGRPAPRVYRKFGLCRICLREMAHAGEAARRARRAAGKRSTGLKHHDDDGPDRRLLDASAQRPTRRITTR